LGDAHRVPTAQGARRILWRISNASMEALAAAARRAFAERMTKQLAKELPQRKAEHGPRFSGTVLRGIELARSHGFAKEPEIHSFLQLWFSSGLDLERRWPGSSKVLRDERLAPRSKIALLQELAK
jgi:hypothetical protein